MNNYEIIDNYIEEIVYKKFKKTRQMNKNDKYYIEAKFTIQLLFAEAHKTTIENIYTYSLKDLKKISLRIRLQFNKAIREMDNVAALVRRGLSYLSYYEKYIEPLENNEDIAFQRGEDFINSMYKDNFIGLTAIYEHDMKINNVYDFDIKLAPYFEYIKRDDLLPYYENAKYVFEVPEIKQIVVYFYFNQYKDVRPYSALFQNPSSQLYSEKHLVKNQDTIDTGNLLLGEFLKKYNLRKDDDLIYTYLGNMSDRAIQTATLLRGMRSGSNVYFAEAYNDMDEKVKNQLKDYKFTSVYMIYNHIKGYKKEVPFARGMTVELLQESLKNVHELKKKEFERVNNEIQR